MSQRKHFLPTNWVKSSNKIESNNHLVVISSNLELQKGTTIEAFWIENTKTIKYRYLRLIKTFIYLCWLVLSIYHNKILNGHIKKGSRIERKERRNMGWILKQRWWIILCWALWLLLWQTLLLRYKPRLWARNMQRCSSRCIYNLNSSVIYS